MTELNLKNINADFREVYSIQDIIHDYLKDTKAKSFNYKIIIRVNSKEKSEGVIK